MTGNFKKLIDSVQVDIVLTDMLYQWANTPTGITAPNKHGQIPKHELIENNLRSGMLSMTRALKKVQMLISKNSKDLLKKQVLTSILNSMKQSGLSMSMSDSIQF